MIIQRLLKLNSLTRNEKPVGIHNAKYECFFVTLWEPRTSGKFFMTPKKNTSGKFFMTPEKKHQIISVVCVSIDHLQQSFLYSFASGLSPLTFYRQYQTYNARLTRSSRWFLNINIHVIYNCVKNLSKLVQSWSISKHEVCKQAFSSYILYIKYMN